MPHIGQAREEYRTLVSLLRCFFGKGNMQDTSLRFIFLRPREFSLWVFFSPTSQLSKITPSKKIFLTCAHAHAVDVVVDIYILYFVAFLRSFSEFITINSVIFRGNGNKLGRNPYFLRRNFRRFSSKKAVFWGYFHPLFHALFAKNRVFKLVVH